MSSNNNNNKNNKQPLDLTESLQVFDKAQAPSTTTANVGDVELGILEINRVAAAPQNPVQSAEAFTTTRNLSRSDELTIGFLLDCAKRGQNCSNQRPPSICKVSRILRDHNESSFEPQLVSIGPIHREDPKLKEFEWRKECYLNDLLNRCEDSTPKVILEACLLKINTLIPQIRKCYADVKKNYTDDELARMMVMDGCFILEFCFKHKDEDLYLPNKMQNLRIAMDLMLLENQVPFFVLQDLFDCSMGEVPFSLSNVLDAYLAPYIKLFHRFPEKKSTTDVHSDLPEKKSIFSNVLDKYLAPCIKLFRSRLPEKILTTDVDSNSTHDHVLGYLHTRHQLVVAKSSNGEDTPFHSIVELGRSGMNFKSHQEDDVWSMTIKFQSPRFACLPGFWSTPTLLMPTLVIDDMIELILRNFIAYEQSFPHNRYYFTSYAHAMSMLIDTKEDIAKLVESKVLVNTLGSNQEAADLINKICKNISITDFYYTQAFKQMDKYYNAFCPMIKRTYFSNPWNAINLVAGIIAFLATVVSAYVGVLEFSDGSNQ